ncbi:hypothetical protein CH339_18980 [Rhodobium orientis]|uniref:Uncharacterized protein n=1 Tax=Rhodobium orientis TaxID=34017 RepID=A0A327JK96_9HYPH|nr:hypothetical protein [Rhodobium orientis]RAI25232.1 hypothetical protein CH339_18980 [Rhodobium orientis]
MAIAIASTAELTTKVTTSTSSALRRMLDKVTRGRELQAKKYVNGYLLTLDDETLAELGYDRKKIEAEGANPFPY